MQKSTAIISAGSIMLCIIFLCLFFKSSLFESGHQTPHSVSNVRQAPSFALQNSRGKSVRLEDLKGSPIVLHFWASWCGPCLQEIPQWLELAASMKNKNVKFVGISLDQTWDDARKVIPDDRLPENVISLLDSKLEVSERYGSFQFPESYLLNSKHEIVMKWVGPQDWESKKSLLEPISKDHAAQ